MDKILEQVGSLEISMDNLKTLIDDAVQAGMNAGRKETDKTQFREVEKRLYAYPDKKAKIEKYKQDIEDLKIEKYSGRSKDIVRMQQAGVRLSPDEIQETRIADIEMKIRKLEDEVKIIDWALECVKWRDTDRTIREEGFEIIEMKYFRHLSIEEISKQLYCSESTVKRRKNRLVNRLVIYLCDEN